MIDNYRQLQQWNKWLVKSVLGENILTAEQEVFSSLLKSPDGTRCVLIGVPEQVKVLQNLSYPLQTLLSPLVFESTMQHVAVKTNNQQKIDLVEANYHEIPLLTASIDLVLLPHTLELVDNPRRVLSEICRVIKPEGYLLIAGFNPKSIWGLLRYVVKKRLEIPTYHKFIPPYKLINWLKLADFELISNLTACYRAPIQHGMLYNLLHKLEPLAKLCFPKYGGIYFVMAKAKLIPLTPIKMNWQQSLGSVRFSNSLTGTLVQSVQNRR